VQITPFAEVHRRLSAVHLEAVHAGLGVDLRELELALSVQVHPAEDTPPEPQRNCLAVDAVHAMDWLVIASDVVHTGTVAQSS
jgi:hypothetical protein